MNCLENFYIKFYQHQEVFIDEQNTYDMNFFLQYLKICKASRLAHSNYTSSTASAPCSICSMTLGQYTTLLHETHQ